MRRWLLGAVVLAAACSTVKPLDRGLALYGQGQYREARAAFDEAIRRSPTSAAAYSHRADARMRLGEVDGAIGSETVGEAGHETQARAQTEGPADEVH